MSPAKASWLLGLTILCPFAFAVAAAMLARSERPRRAVAVLYAVATAALDLTLLNTYLSSRRAVAWGSLRLENLGFPLMLALNLIGATVVLYAGFRKSELPGRSVLLATVPLASGLGSLALLARGLASFAILWEGVTAAALLGLLAQGRGDLARRMRAFAPWLVADALFLLGAILSGTLLKENALLVKPPLTAGGEAQLVVVMLLFLSSALIRLGAFPFHFWVGDCSGRADPAWCAFFVGTANFLLAGFRTLAAAAMIARLVSGNWSTALAVIGLVSVVAGPLLAVRSRDVPGFIAGMYSMQAGFVIAGLALFSRIGFEGASFIVLVAPLSLSAIMMASGTLSELRGSREFDRHPLPVGAAPAAFGVFLLSGLSLAGIPPLDGFAGKALVMLGCVEGSTVNPQFALAAAVMLSGTAVALVAVIRAAGGQFTAMDAGRPLGRPGLMEEMAPLALVGGSLLFGVFPGLVLRNFLDSGWRLLFPGGFNGPSVTLRLNDSSAVGFLRSSSTWPSGAAAFLVGVSALALILYFASRSHRPPEDAPGTLLPFVGGAAGDYSPSMDIDDSFVARGFRSILGVARR